MLEIILWGLVRVLIYYYLGAIGYWFVTKGIKGGAEGKSDTLKTKKLMVVFGSGGHTTEMLLMLTKGNQFRFDKYREVQFVIGKSDTWSFTKIKDFLSRGNIDVERDVPNLRVIKLFRSREVKQSYITSIGTTLYALLHSFFVVAANRPDIVSFISCNIYRS